MRTYVYKGFDRGGHACKGLVEALGVKDAREKLSQQGVLAERISLTSRRLRFSRDIRAVVYEELAELLRAGMSLVKALDVLIATPELQNVATILAGVRDAVREGDSFARALADASPSVGTLEVAILEAAEKSATVELMLERLSVFLLEESQLRDRVQSALIYPAIVLAAGVCVAILMLGVVLPRAQGILSGPYVDLPLLTRFMTAFGVWSMRVGPVVIAVVIGVCVYVRRRVRNDRAFRLRWDRRLFRWPLVGPGYRILANVRFARTMDILLKGGVGLIDALGLAARATGSVWIDERMCGEAERVRHGARLSEAVRAVEPLSGLSGSCEVGETSGSLGRLLSGAAARGEREWERFVSRRLALLEPVLILVIGIFVLLVTLAILLPVFSLSQTIR